jgi:replicative DNA helicase
MSLEAEQNLIGCALIDQNAIPKLLEIPEDWFLANEHKTIIRAINSLASRSLSCDMFSLDDELNRTVGQNDTIGIEYLNDLVEQLPNIDHFDSYKRVLFDAYKSNNLTNAVLNINAQIKSKTPVVEIIQYMQDKVLELLTDHNTKKPESIKYYLNELTKQMQYRLDNPNAKIGLQTGYENLDRTIGGFEKEKVYVIGARPSMGKSAFSLVDLGLRISKDTKEPIVAFSLEMKGSALVARMVCNKATLNSEKIKNAKMTDDEWTSFVQVCHVMEKQNNLYIDERGGLSTAQIRAAVKAIQIKHGAIGGIIIDHIGLIKKNPKKSETEAMNQIANELLAMAKEFECPMIELTQLNRGVENRPDKRPILADIKQSAAIEENADVAMFIYRDDYYYEDTDIPNVTELIVAKNREGECKSLYFNHQMQYSQYTPIDNFVKPQKTKQKKGNF